MEDNEIMNVENEEEVMVPEEEETTSNNALLWAAIGAVATGVSVLLYQKVVKPIREKHKAKKKQSIIQAHYAEVPDEDEDESEE